MFSVLAGDTIHSSSVPEISRGTRLTYLWIANEDTLGIDTTETVIFEDLGEYLVQCQVSGGEFTAAVRWHVTSEQFYIEGYAPDSLSMTIRRPREIDFSLGVRAIEGLQPNYSWLLTDRGRHQIDIGEDAEMSYNFDLKGEHQLEGRVYYEDTEHSVFW